MYILVGIGIYLAIGYLCHLLIFPEKKPDISTYFRPGDQFYSKAEGVNQTVIKQENGLVHCTMYMEPLAPGPPEHIHTGFDEVFEVSNGELSLMVNGVVQKVVPGQKILIPKGTSHKPFNETADTIHVAGTIAFPEKFAFYLLQIYGIMDNDPAFGKSASTIAKIGLLHQAGFDSYRAKPPVAVQKVMSFLLTPAARLMGYKSYYPNYVVKR